MKPIINKEWFKKVARSAGCDAGDRSMRKGKRKAWNEEDYYEAVREFVRLMDERRNEGWISKSKLEDGGR